MQIDIPIIEENLKVKAKTKIAILASRFNHEIVDNLIQGAMEGLTRFGIEKDSISLYQVPGAFELPIAAQKIAPQYDGCIALGAVIRGDTPHFEFISNECAHGLMRVSLDLKKPIIFGVLTTNTLEQAQARSNPKNNKGFEAALTLLEIINLFDKIKL
jgi:6,7-dimethyl-8-ribityllumazine synthase